MVTDNQQFLLVLTIRNKLHRRAFELINSRTITQREDIKQVLDNHFGDSRDLSALIKDLRRMRN